MKTLRLIGELILYSLMAGTFFYLLLESEDTTRTLLLGAMVFISVLLVVAVLIQILEKRIDKKCPVCNGEGFVYYYVGPGADIQIDKGAHEYVINNSPASTYSQPCPLCNNS